MALDKLHSDDAESIMEESSLARSVIYKFFSYAYRYPDEANIKCLDGLWEGMDSAVSVFKSLAPLLQRLKEHFDISLSPKIEDEYVVLFGHTAQGSCPPFELEYGDGGNDIKKPHELSDISAFYRAAGLKLSGRAKERVDFVAIEMEFMNFLCFKQSFAEEKNDSGLVDSCNVLQAKFLKDHLARWMPAFTRRVMECSKEFYGNLAQLTLQFVLDECAKLKVESGSSELMVCVQTELPEACNDCSLTSKGMN